MNDATEIDRHNCRRVVPMKVLVLGLSRTGTDSMRKALKILNYNDVYHGYAAAFENPKDCEMWLEAFDAKYHGIGKPFGRAEFDKLLGHCEAICDVPAVCFAPELISAYPEAKVILTDRNVDDWHSSVNSALVKNVYCRSAVITSFLAWVFRSSNRHTRPAFLRVWDDYFQGTFATTGKQTYLQHYDMVRSLVPKDRLLEYRVQQGWGPLCEFLDVPVPHSTFPRGNEKEETTRRIMSLVQYEMRKAAKNVLWFLGLFYLSAILFFSVHPDRRILTRVPPLPHTLEKSPTQQLLPQDLGIGFNENVVTGSDVVVQVEGLDIMVFSARDFESRALVEVVE